MDKETFYSRVTRGLLGRLLLWFIGAGIIFAVSEWVHTAYWPPISTDVAVGQIEDSDAAFTAMQTTEQVKNSFSTVSILLVAVWTVLLWLGYAVRSFFKLQQLVKETI